MGKPLGKRFTTKLNSRDEFDPENPDQYLLGWYSGHWELVCDLKLTYGECCKVFEKGLDPYTKFMVVSPSEFAHLGLPQDEAASEYFSLAKQREVSLRNNSGKRAKTPGEFKAITERITDPRGE